MKTRFFALLAFVVISCASAFAQIQVKGNVSDKNSEPMIGVAVQEKGNINNGTITDLDGNFTLKVNSDATLVVSYVGYKRQLPVGTTALIAAGLGHFTLGNSHG